MLVITEAGDGHMGFHYSYIFFIPKIKSKSYFFKTTCLS